MTYLEGEATPVAQVPLEAEVKEAIERLIITSAPDGYPHMQTFGFHGNLLDDPITTRKDRIRGLGVTVATVGIVDAAFTEWDQLHYDPNENRESAEREMSAALRPIISTILDGGETVIECEQPNTQGLEMCDQYVAYDITSTDGLSQFARQQIREDTDHDLEQSQRDAITEALDSSSQPRTEESDAKQIAELNEAIEAHAATYADSAYPSNSLPGFEGMFVAIGAVVAALAYFGKKQYRDRQEALINAFWDARNQAIELKASLNIAATDPEVDSEQRTQHRELYRTIDRAIDTIGAKHLKGVQPTEGGAEKRTELSGHFLSRWAVK